MAKETKDPIRRDTDGVPIVVVTRQIQLLCHDVKVVNGSGKPEAVKLSVTRPFLDELNTAALDLLEYGIGKAAADGRTTLMKEDIPPIKALLDLEDDEQD
jgi:hypothetical protein